LEAAGFLREPYALDESAVSLTATNTSTRVDSVKFVSKRSEDLSGEEASARYGGAGGVEKVNAFWWHGSNIAGAGGMASCLFSFLFSELAIQTH
jgi:hypothetical protein